MHWKGVNSVSSASDLSDCTSVVIEAFTVPSGKTITIRRRARSSHRMVISHSLRRQVSRGIYNPNYLEAVETVGINVYLRGLDATTNKGLLLYVFYFVAPRPRL
ncbi:uncharacterized protein EI90DRAFT_3074065 [Cantharellus anzutake]|uniref:uncharacterized protein n=1 Tax=Cantharellus anzutake TaxID=1750568 RepID=UPI001903C3CE|nr:uncharacterized protein EI90DRAFT_3074065 [Cantharellus anzutake]KAF8325012.1 hypothetical protein EI90DRAFT_3074065 [Cantharellus anzutake]